MRVSIVIPARNEAPQIGTTVGGLVQALEANGVGDFEVLVVDDAEAAAIRERAVMGVAALPMSICPQAILCARPSSEVDFVNPVTACLAAV